MPVSCGIFYLYNQSRTTQNVYNIPERFVNRTQEMPLPLLNQFYFLFSVNDILQQYLKGLYSERCVILRDGASAVPLVECNR